MRRIGISLLLSAALVGGETSAADWWRIGLQTASWKSENDTFRVKSDQQFQYIRLQVHDAGVIIERWTLIYRDGSSQAVGFLGYAAPGGEFPPIPVRSNLKEVRFTYYSAPGPRKGRVEIQGMR